MRRRLDLATGLVGNPRIVFLDEPTAGLDPRSGRTMWRIVRDLVAGGVTIFLTTQYLREADQLADRTALSDRGRLVAKGTPAELKRRVPSGHVRLAFADADGLETAVRTLRGSARDDDPLTLRVPTDGSIGSLKAVLIILLTVAAAVQGTAIPVAMDRATGIIARFRTMAISRASVLTGPAEWVGAIGVVTLVAWALTWRTVALGLATKSVEAASNLPQPLILLPFFGSGFVPTDSMPTGMRWFAEYQPFTPIVDTLRGLLLGTSIANSALLSVARCAAITLIGLV